METGLAPSIGAKDRPTSSLTGSSGTHPVQLWLAGLLCFNLIKNEDSRTCLAPIFFVVSTRVWILAATRNGRASPSEAVNAGGGL